MTERSLRHVDHIIKSIDVVIDFVAECSEDEFGSNMMLYDAVLYNLQAMSESRGCQKNGKISIVI